MKLLRKLNLIILVLLTSITASMPYKTAYAQNYTININSDTTISTLGYYYFTLDKPGLIKIRAANPSNPSECEYQIFKYDTLTGNLNILGNPYNAADESKTYRIGSGTYCLYFYYDLPGTVRIDYESEAPDTTEQEWNNSFDTAQTVTLNSLYQASALDNGDNDYYKFTLVNPGSLYLSIKQGGLNGSYAGKFELYSEDSLGNVSLVTATEITKQAAAGSRYRLNAGTYYVKEIPLLQGVYNQDYQFKIIYSAENAISYETEENDDINTADNILTNQEYIGNIQSSDDYDYYKFTIDRSSQIALQLTQPRETVKGTYLIELYQQEDDELIPIDVFTTSSNPVNFGEKLVLLPGDYYIKISGTKKNDISMTDYQIKVNADPITLVSSITLSPSTSSVYTGATLSLIPTISPSDAGNKALIWSSSDHTVATVNKKGKITCVSSGECYIYACSTDGSDITARYRLIVEKDGNNNLASMKYSAGMLSQKFSPDTVNYTLTLNREEQVTLSFIKESKYAACYINDKKISKTTIRLGPGKSKKIEVVIAAENGQEKYYIITIKRKK